MTYSLTLVAIVIFDGIIIMEGVVSPWFGLFKEVLDLLSYIVILSIELGFVNGVAETDWFILFEVLAIEWLIIV